MASKSAPISDGSAEAGAGGRHVDPDRVRRAETSSRSQQYQRTHQLFRHSTSARTRRHSHDDKGNIGQRTDQKYDDSRSSAALVKHEVGPVYSLV
eukprot:scaffold5803_cov39-Prasinocladus_malaysianus.AAC.2